MGEGTAQQQKKAKAESGAIKEQQSNSEPLMRLSNKQEESVQTFRTSTKTIHQMWKDEERKREKLEITLTTLKKQDLEKGGGVGR